MCWEKSVFKETKIKFLFTQRRFFAIFEFDFIFPPHIVIIPDTELFLEFVSMIASELQKQQCEVFYPIGLKSEWTRRVAQSIDRNEIRSN